MAQKNNDNSGNRPDDDDAKRSRSAPDWDRLAHEWLDLWEREVATRLTDPAQLEAFSGMITGWLGQLVRNGFAEGAWGKKAAADRQDSDATKTYTAPAREPSRTQAAADASHARSAELGAAGHIARLEARIAKLERALALIERKRAGVRPSARKPRRK